MTQGLARQKTTHVSICVNSVDVIKISGKRASSSFLVVVLVVVVVLEPRRSIAIANAWTHDDARGRTSGGCKRPTPEEGCRVRACVNRFESETCACAVKVVDPIIKN